jgi:hypothetical protein
MSLVKSNRITNLNNDGPVEFIEGLEVPSNKQLVLRGKISDGTTTGVSGQYLVTTPTGVTWAGLPQGLSSSSDVTFRNITSSQDVIVNGSLTVNGTSIGLSNLGIGSNEVTLNNDVTGSPVDDANIIVNRGLEPDTRLRWNELEQRWQFTNDGVIYYNMLLPTETDFGGPEQFGASGDDTVYSVASTGTRTISSVTYTRLNFAGSEDYRNFRINHRIKVFGGSKTSISALPGTLIDASIDATSVYENIVYNSNPRSFYVYFVAQYGMQNGDIGAAAWTGEILENINLNILNEANYNRLILTRSSQEFGFLIYRGVYSTLNEANAATSTRENVRLIGVLGPRDLGNSVTGINWIDYGSYDVPNWTDRNSTGTYRSSLIHFPLNPPTQSRRGWFECGLKEIGNNYIVLDELLTVSSSDIKVVHDDTQAIQGVIDAAFTEGRNFVVVPGGTYLLKTLRVPDDFTLQGLSDATTFKKQYFDTSVLNDITREGTKNALIISRNYNFNIAGQITGPKRFSISDIVLNGNKENNILMSISSIGENANNSLMSFPNSQFVTIRNVRIEDTVGSAIFGVGSNTLAIENATILRGSETERYPIPAVEITDAENIKIANTIFRRFPGPVNLSTTQVLSVTGCIIRDCGTGLRVYGSGKMNVLNNIILGPSDEYIPVPDVYDSDYNSVNINVNKGVDFFSPVLQYIERGQKKNLTNTDIKASIYRISKTNSVETIDRNNPVTRGGEPLLQLISSPVEIEEGQLKFKISAVDTSILPEPAANQYLGHEIVGTEFLDKGGDTEITLGAGVYSIAQNTYTITLTSAGDQYFDQIAIGDVVRLVAHSYSPSALITNLTVQTKVSSAASKQITLSIPPGVSINTNGSGGYFQLRRIFIVARGIVGVF